MQRPKSTELAARLSNCIEAVDRATTRLERAREQAEATVKELEHVITMVEWDV